MNDIKCKIVLNKCYGGYVLSNKFMNYMTDKTEHNTHDPSQKFYWDYNHFGAIDDFAECSSVLLRSHQFLIDCIEQYGEKKASGPHAELKVISIPSRILPGAYISEHDGYETIHEDHFKA